MKNLFTLISLLFTSLAFAQTPVLLKDINPVIGNGLNQFDNGIAQFNGRVYFTADDGQTGDELWVTDGTEAGTMLLKDIREGAESSEPQNYYAVNGDLLFTANDGVHGVELWRTDGTTDGTVIVKDIGPNDLDGVTFGIDANESFFVWNEILYFTANDGSAGWEFWKSDGTEAGTTMVSNISAFGHSFPKDYALHNGLLYFQARGAGSEELWVSDGTAANTKRVADIAVTFGSNPSDLISCNGFLLFIADDGNTGDELWRSDGTEAGTVLVKDIDPSSFGNGLQTQPNTFEKRLVKIGDVVFFSADDGVNGRELWRSDGTADGTFMVKDASDDPSGYAPQNFAVIGDVLYYKYDDGVNGQELWRSDGTEGGTYLVKDIVQGSNGSFSLPTHIYAFDGTLYFGAANGSSFNRELWKSDGTEAGTVLAADINPDGGSNPFQFFGFDETLYMIANHVDYGWEMWALSTNILPLSSEAQITGEILCAGDMTGAIEVNAIGGVPPYTYEWTPSSVQGPNPTGLGPGIYTVTITDSANSTYAISASFTEPIELNAFTESTPENPGQFDGTASIIGLGGTPPYSYLWNTPNQDTSAMVGGLAWGEYDVVVTDANGCMLQVTIIVDHIDAAIETFGDSFTLSPTLTKGQFSIISQQPYYGFEIKLFDNFGRSVQSWKDVSTNHSLDVSHLNAGLYLVFVKMKEGAFAKRLVIAK